MADVYKIGISIAATNNVSGVLNVIGKDVLGLHHQIGNLQGGFNRLHLAAAGLGGVLAGSAMLGGVSKLIEAGGRLVDQQIQLKNLGVSTTELAQATAAAWQSVGDVIGSNVSRSLELIREAKGALGTMPAAIAIAPDLERADIVRSFVAGHQDDRGLQMVMKAIEMRGDVKYDAAGKLDLGAARTGLNAALKFLNASGGQIDAGTLKGLVTQAGPMAKMMQPDAFYRTMLTVTEELQQKAGTALSAAGRALYGGIMPQRNVVEMERLGLINPKAVTVRRGGNVQVAQGGLTGFDVLNGPGGLAEWTDKVLRPLFHVDFLRAHARTPGLSESQYDQQELYRAFPTDTFRRLAGIFLQQAESVQKGAANYDQAKGLDASKTVMDGSLTANMKAFTEAWSNLTQALGVPLVAEATVMLQRITVSVNSLAQWAAAHPETVKVIEEITVGLGGLLVLGGSLAIAGAALAPFTAGLGGLVAILSSTGVVTGAAAAATLGTGLAGVATGLGLLSAAVIGLPPLLKKSVDAVNHALGIQTSAALPHNNTVMPGAPTSMWPGGARFSGHTWHDYHPPAPAVPVTGGGRGSVHASPASYVPPPQDNRPIVIQHATYLDGHVLYRSNTEYANRDARSGAQHGMTGFDSSETPFPSGGMVSI